MTKLNADDGRARGQAIRQARASRVRMIRRRVIAGAVALFVATWLMIAVALASGHDPALSAKTTTVAAPGTGTSTTDATAASDQTSTGTTTTTTGSTGSTASGSSSSNGTTSSVTTRAS
ncbi:MAG: hypothetical protein ABSG43_09030 [Solirubrobacteraceae bacterium]|jgi:hypothetical protein